MLLYHYIKQQPNKTTPKKLSQNDCKIFSKLLTHSQIILTEHIPHFSYQAQVKDGVVLKSSNTQKLPLKRKNFVCQQRELNTQVYVMTQAISAIKALKNISRATAGTPSR